MLYPVEWQKLRRLTIVNSGEAIRNSNPLQWEYKIVHPLWKKA